jgi:Putative zincin peptidase
MSLQLIDRYHPQARREKQAHIDMGHLRKIEELALLEGEQLRPLALLSLIMLIISGIFFVVLDLLSYFGHYQHWLAPLSVGGIVIWLLLNSIGYILILGVHEIIHGIVFAFWGGKPHFGAKLPLALYCGARQQLFARNYYLAVGLAPLVLITIAGIIVTVLYPGVAAYMLMAFAGNFSGAAGDVVASRNVARLPAQILIEDTEVGYTAWEIVPDRAVVASEA